MCDYHGSGPIWYPVCQIPTSAFVSGHVEIPMLGVMIDSNLERKKLNIEYTSQYQNIGDLHHCHRRKITEMGGYQRMSLQTLVTERQRKGL